jgi:hypothetical protein
MSNIKWLATSTSSLLFWKGKFSFINVKRSTESVCVLNNKNLSFDTFKKTQYQTSPMKRLNQGPNEEKRDIYSKSAKIWILLKILKSLFHFTFNFLVIYWKGIRNFDNEFVGCAVSYNVKKIQHEQMKKQQILHLINKVEKIWMKGKQCEGRTYTMKSFVEESPWVWYSLKMTNVNWSNPKTRNHWLNQKLYQQKWTEQHWKRLSKSMTIWFEQNWNSVRREEATDQIKITDIFIWTFSCVWTVWSSCTSCSRVLTVVTWTFIICCSVPKKSSLVWFVWKRNIEMK